MSTTTAGGPTDVTGIGDVAAYAEAVRRHLVGLTPEQVDDLTDDLEADLADTLADSSRDATGGGAGGGASSKSGDLVARFGPPAAYAAELRSAAGLPDDASAGGRASVRARLSSAVMTRADRVLAVLRAQPWWEPVSEFVVALRPFGWVVRGWVVFQVLDGWRNIVVTSYGAGLEWWPRGLAAQLVLIAMIVVSVQWGRGRWLPPRWVRSAPRWATVVAIVALLPVLAETQPETTYVEVGGYTNTVYMDSEPRDGVVVDGMAVSNLFVYDADGNPLDDVQIYDDRGRPVSTAADEEATVWSLPGVDEPWSFEPVLDEDGRARWNVYPLYGAPASSFEWRNDEGYELVDGATTRVPPRPFAQAPAIIAHDVSGSAVPTGPEVSAAPEVSASPGARPSPGVQASPGASAAPGPSAPPTVAP